ncbi:axeA1 [Symbiodinium natans]|uniref:AxeA1 protein n=1 Tax=Symbiodinium natans TaxID=878477 RepID=A0A812U9E3_9DINO|nr:axeA1 [Symbiodinium natans]
MNMVPAPASWFVKLDASWVRNVPDTSNMFLRPGADVTFGGHDMYVEGQKHARKFRWGRCPWHNQRAMVPWVVPDGAHAGDLILICSGYWDRDYIGRCACFFKHEFPRSRISELSPETKAEWISFRAALSRGARP